MPPKGNSLAACELRLTVHQPPQLTLLTLKHHVGILDILESESASVFLMAEGQSFSVVFSPYTVGVNKKFP